MSDFQNNEQLYRNLISLLKEFKNRPWHLAKYLIEKDALSEDFINEVLNSDKLKKMDENETKALVKAVYFVDISHMNDYLNSLTDESDPKKRSMSSLSEQELNQKLDQYLKEERYEDAIRIRDYMNKHNIKRNS